MPDQRSLNSLYWFSTDCSTRTRHISLICFLCLLTPELESKCRTVVANNFENYLQMFRWFSPSDELRKTCFFNISVNSYKADLVLLSTKLHSFWTQRRDSNIESVPSKHKLHSWLCCSSHHYSLRSEIVWRHQTSTITFSLQNTFENYLTKPLCKIFAVWLCVASVRDIATTAHSPQTAAINTDPATARPNTFQRTHKPNIFLS